MLLSVMALFLVLAQARKLWRVLPYRVLLFIVSVISFLENTLVPGSLGIICLKPGKNYKVDSWAHLCMQVSVDILS